jgi:hypothetical protein
MRIKNAKRVKATAVIMGGTSNEQAERMDGSKRARRQAS